MELWVRKGLYRSIEVISTFGSEVVGDHNVDLHLQGRTFTSSKSKHSLQRQEVEAVSFLRPRPWNWHGVTSAFLSLSVVREPDSRDKGQGHRIHLLVGGISKNLGAPLQDCHIILNVISSERSCLVISSYAALATAQITITILLWFSSYHHYLWMQVMHSQVMNGLFFFCECIYLIA